MGPHGYLDIKICKIADKGNCCNIKNLGHFKRSEVRDLTTNVFGHLGMNAFSLGWERNS